MVIEAVVCPHCQQAEPVVKHGVNRGGTARCLCKDCKKTFTPKPNPRRVSAKTEQKILAALAERLSVEAIARLLRVGKATVYRTMRKKDTATA